MFNIKQRRLLLTGIMHYRMTCPSSLPHKDPLFDYILPILDIQKCIFNYPIFDVWISNNGHFYNILKRILDIQK